MLFNNINYLSISIAITTFFILIVFKIKAPYGRHSSNNWGKIFSLADVESFNGVNVKFNSEKAMELREEYFGVTPALHMSKKHWNTISVDGSISDNLIKEMNY